MLWGVLVSRDGTRYNNNNNEVVLRGEISDSAKEFNERRKKSDWLVKASIYMSASAWVVLFAVWCIMYMAAEYQPGIFNIFLQVDVPRNPLTQTLLPIAFTLLLFSLAICILAFLFNRLRMRRKTDRYRKSIFIVGGITIIALIAFLMNFGSSFLW